MNTYRIGQRMQFEMDARWRVESVERALEQLEMFLPHAKDQAFLRKKQELKSCREDFDKRMIEAEVEMMEIEWSNRFPAYFYGSLLVLLWSETEAVIERFAATVKSTKRISLAFDDISGKTTYSRLRKYVQAVLGVPLPDNSAIEDLQFLRNFYAHHGGNTDTQTEARMKRIKAIIQARPGVYLSQTDTFVLVDAKYLRNAIDSSKSLITALCAAHPSTELDIVAIKPEGPN